ncbi:MAG TPA: helix-hairpin-helix domain-containing protein [Ferruginibacter sp.]|nr:helix-hairpin-helix domain-containing protein [Ferruginibacter sp.]HRO17295.1 helix-hairpin-helix domain-containing protein [Ferruginibacter sp.]HRQ20584.1 helix-hairpin-helix domain-containing protein [Ferruginibacter sp.]
MMRVLFLCLFCPLCSNAQELPARTEELLEQMADLDAEEVDITEQEGVFAYRLKHPVNINEDDGTGLAELGLLSPLHIQWLLEHRKVFGAFLHVYELQAVPGWDATVFKQLQPFITVRSHEPALPWRTLFKSGKHQWIVRYRRVLEQAAGYRLNGRETTPYVGSPESMLFRYRYQVQPALQMHILGKKDAGEPFLKGRNRAGFDFLSAHVQYRSKGILRKLVVGDFTVSMGQGLVQWQGFSVGGEIASLKQQGEVVRAYGGAGEFAFYRGAAISLQKRKWHGNVFGSYRSLDGNLKADSSGKYVTSIQTGGYHRTPSEMEDKGVLKQMAWGATLHRKFSKATLGVNWMQQRYNMPVMPEPSVYNRFYFRGDALQSVGVDGVYYGKHYQLFGEVAHTNGVLAYTGGLMMSTSAKSDVGFRFRHVPADFHVSGQSRAALQSNETGCLMLLNIRPTQRLRINANVELFRHPFFKFRINGPSHGRRYGIHLFYKPNKQFEALAYYTAVHRSQNEEDVLERIAPVAFQSTQRFRIHVQWVLNRSFKIRSRFEAKWFRSENSTTESGSLWFGDVLYQPLGSRWKGSARIMFFNTDSYNTRIYAYEQDLHPGTVIPMVYGQGVRLYLTGQFKFTEHVSFSLKLARSMYQTNDGIGSGYEKIEGSSKTQVGIQGTITF